MDVRAQTAMVFHLDKCIGCHTCSIACKNIWTDRCGTEYMWWNNVETKPGTGYPFLWEDQEKYRGGWERHDGEVRLRLHNRAQGLANIFYNPALPLIDDYYEPWSYRYSDLLKAEPGSDQPVARAVSLLTGREMEIKTGPNWDDDLGGSALYAARDYNLAALSEEERRELFALERLVLFYLPRICNHCLNPGCVAACPTGAIYKRGEDGIVLVSQEKCRAWRMCISGCPYKKIYYNWQTGKSEKCILCYPRQESGQAPACFHACVGRIRYLGVLLYDAEQIESGEGRPDHELVDAQLDTILDPADPSVRAQALKSGVSEEMIEAALKSPVFLFVKKWRLALPLHPEFRTFPMLFYVPPLLPVAAAVEGGSYQLGGELFGDPTGGRLPVRFFASLLAGGNEELVKASYRKLYAVRLHRRHETVGDVPQEVVKEALAAADCEVQEAEAIFRMTNLAAFDERHQVPPFEREEAIDATVDPQKRKEGAGFGFGHPPKRGH
jgi:nitrate reductase / nitrite oxidoreductase, beta subunit